jgi:hypothetical protein
MVSSFVSTPQVRVPAVVNLDQPDPPEYTLDTNTPIYTLQKKIFTALLEKLKYGPTFKFRLLIPTYIPSNSMLSTSKYH